MRTVSGAAPTFPATQTIVAYSVACPGRASATNRTARAFASGVNRIPLDTAPSPHGQAPPQNPDRFTRADGLRRDAAPYAAEHRISLAEATTRLALQDRARDLEASLQAADPATYAGLYLSHAPAFRITVNVTTSAAAARARAAAVSAGLGGITNVRTVRWSVAQLVDAATAAQHAVRAAGVHADSGIDVRTNRPEVYVTDASAVTRAGARVPAPAVLRVVPGLVRPAATLTGGMGITNCTSGFAVMHNVSYNRGVTTAGHCPDWQGSLMPFQSALYGGSYDVQWHTASSGNTVSAQFWDGSAHRNVYGSKLRSSQVVGEYVCKYGQVTGYKCGYIQDKNYNPELWAPTLCAATWVRVQNGSQNLVDGGDSGGPWFNGNTAYGTTMGEMTDGGGVYMAIDYIAGLNLRLLVAG